MDKSNNETSWLDIYSSCRYIEPFSHQYDQKPLVEHIIDVAKSNHVYGHSKHCICQNEFVIITFDICSYKYLCC